MRPFRLLVASFVACGLLPQATAVTAEPASFTPRGATAPEYEGDALRSADIRIRAPQDHGKVELVGTVFWRGPGASQPAGQRPVILIPTPYNSEPYARTGDATNVDVTAYFTEHGYAVVVADARGTGRSGGCADLIGPDTARDLATWVDHLAAQDWATRRIGGFGFSYSGEILKAGLDLVSEKLRTVVNVSAASGAYDFVAMDGAPYWDTGVQNAGFSLADETSPNGHEPLVVGRRYGCRTEYAKAIDFRGTMTPFLRDREYRADVKEVRASVLEIAGLDEGPAQSHQFERWFDELPTFHRGVLGQWDHGSPGRFRADFMDMLHAWYDRELLGHATGIEQWPVLQVQRSNGTWRAVDSFAGLAADVREYGLRSDGTLGHGRVGGGLSWKEIEPGHRDGPTRDFPFTLTPVVTTPVFGRVELVSEALRRPLHLSGVAELDVEIRVDRTDAHFVVAVDALYGDTVCELTRGGLSARHRLSLDHPTKVPVGQWVPYRIRTWAFDADLEPGMQLRLRIAGGDDTFVPAGSEYTATIRTDGSASLRLPVADDSHELDVVSPTAKPQCPARLSTG